MNWKNNVIKNFDSKVSSYDSNSEIQKTVAETLINDLPDEQSASEITDILEVGCGTGHLTGLLFDRYQNKNICVSDISASMVTQAQINCQRIADDKDHNTRWAVFDAEYPPDDMRGSYDLIVANMVFQWFEDPQRGLNSLSELLKPNGKIIYSMAGGESFKEWKAVLDKLDLPVGVLDVKAPKDLYREEYLIKTYKNAAAFLHTIKGIGAGQARKGYKRLSLKQVKQACDMFDNNYDTSITWHVLYGAVQNKKNGIKKLIGL